MFPLFRIEADKYKKNELLMSETGCMAGLFKETIIKHERR